MNSATPQANATFIAACAGPAEAMAKSTIAAIDGFKKQRLRFKLEQFQVGVNAMNEELSGIIAAWLEEIL